MRVAIVGAGLFGRMLAWTLLDRGAKVTLIDKHARDHLGAGRVAAGMIAPATEAVLADSIVERLGSRSLELWPKYLKQLKAQTAQSVFFRKSGTLVVAHKQDHPKWVQYMRHAGSKLSLQNYRSLDQEALEVIAPQIAQKFSHAGYFPEEAVLDNNQLFDSLAYYIDRAKADWHEHSKIDSFANDGKLPGYRQSFDKVFDCRGVGARCDNSSLRAVRGEVIRVWAPEVDINQTVRMMHPRYPLYVARKQEHHYVIGATQIESSQETPVTVRSALELLSALYSLHSGFAEAQILSMDVGCRPAYEHNLPRIDVDKKRISINGLFRHGYLFTPALLSDLFAMLDAKPLKFPELFHA